MKHNPQITSMFRAAFACFVLLGNTSCVNQIATDIQESNIPINFSAKGKIATTKVTNSVFDQGDKVGLFATITPGSITGKRYINNIYLEYAADASLLPEKTVFYPEGDDNTLDFISYYPYRETGVASGSSLLPISVAADQSDAEKHSQSDFLVAEVSGVTNDTENVELQFKHKLAKLKIVLVPDENGTASELLKAKPRIIATGILTRAEYDLERDTISNLEEAADIFPYGTWTVEDNQLTGKEFILIPQTLNGEGQSFVMEVNGRVYNCQIPDITLSSNTECEIKISATQSNSNLLTSMAGTIKEWETGEEGSTDNKEDYAAIHLSALSFQQSSVYRVYREGLPVAEICREYLNSESLASQAIVVYPVDEEEKADLSNGTVLQLIGRTDSILGGQLSWNTDDEGFVYTAGKRASCTQFYIDGSGNICLDKPEDAVSVNVACYTLRDIRQGVLKEYPVVKVGTQYWMGKDLCATSYRNGSPLTLKTELGDGAGYFKPDEYEIYFYNGEAVLGGELAPDGWKIPSSDDWEQLSLYVNNDASLIKAGEWKGINETDSVSAVSNLTHLGIYPVGSWSNGAHGYAYKMISYWSWDYENNTIPDQLPAFTGSSNGFVSNTSHFSGKTYYKALSIRCIKE